MYKYINILRCSCCDLSLMQMVHETSAMHDCTASTIIKSLGGVNRRDYKGRA